MAYQPGEDAMTLEKFEYYLKARGYQLKSKFLSYTEMMSPTGKFLLVHNREKGTVMAWENLSVFERSPYPKIETVAELIVAHEHLMERYSHDREV
jgi:hypothetical protein